MKDDLKRLMNEFWQETKDYRTEKKIIQNTKESPIKTEYIMRDPTLEDLIEWLNGRIDNDYE